MTPKAKSRLLFLLKAAFSAGLIWLLYRRVDPAATFDQLRGARAGWIAFFFLLLAANTLISSVKWKLLLAADGIVQPLGRLFASHLTGSFFNLFLPSTIGGDAYRIADIGYHSRRSANAAASILADRMTGFLALACYGLFFSIVARGDMPNWDDRLLLLPAVALAGLLAAGFALFEQRALRRLVSCLPGKSGPRAAIVLDKILVSIGTYARRPDIWIKCLLISFVFQLMAIAAVYSLGSALGLGIPFLPFCFFVPFITLMEMIPVSIFGIGLRDTGYVWFMLAVGRSQADAASLSVLYVAATLLYVAAGGIIFIFRRQRILSGNDAHTHADRDVEGDSPDVRQ